jgi:hypothetical protein
MAGMLPAHTARAAPVMLLLLLHMPPVQYSAAATPWAKALNTTALLFVLVLFFKEAEARCG